ncbi:T9SS type A sorting domain-containing protein [Fulvivirgaceae bacterium PWU4]|uniref:T9SS type A sorting domain-containing protein n=1 Tax=Chryseosolibacter histidini TaxID=2782349 RepID=A0AAP2GL94_9BACT|nr:choice-of-anchor tandem repeat GloVer-containing protein [Chryseosolibacter histidini]MBT1700146.1 T9SS type A sorting domain-containing protein [Chryseosolibacter histidini]
MKKTVRFLLLTVAAATLSIHALAQGVLWGMTYEGGSEYGMGGGGVIFKTNADASSYMSVQKVFQFDYPGDRPKSMVMAPNGKFYGVTNYGGRYLSGVLFEYDPATGAYFAVHHFQQSTGYLPNEGIMVASNGKLYGTTPYGGSDGRGVIYEFDPAAGTYHVMFTFLSSFGNQPRSGLIEASNGKFYGTAPWGGSGIYGVIYEFNLASRTAIIKHNFTTATGSAPAGPVMQASNGKLYGMTPEGGANDLGVLYEYDLLTSTYTKHADLTEASGRNPYGGLTESTSNGKLYGLTQWGGANGEGAILQFDPATGVFQSVVALGLTLGGRPVYGFTEAPNGKLYCVTNIRLLELNPATVSVTQRHEFPSEGTNSGGTLTKAYNGKLYGISPVGISGPRGTIFSFDYTTNTFETKIDFNKATNGAYPLGNLVKAGNGKLYGTVSRGGPNNLGFIFELDPATGAVTKKIDFTGTNGATPSGGMSLANNGKLYGMTTNGGSQGLGVLFEYDPASNTYTKKKDFTSPNGQNPTGDLTLASNGKFYGLLPTNFEVPSGYLFEYDPATDAFQSKISFNSAVDGRMPDGTLTQAGNGKLYGTTAAGGTNQSGVLFEYDPVTNTYTKKIDFSSSADLSESSIGTRPVGKLALAADGKLYGMTMFGGYMVNFNNTTGTIFAFDPATGALTRKHRFGCASGACYADGFNPRGSLVLAPDNKLYGMTSSGGQSSLYGVAFQFDPATSVYTKKFDFTQANGASPRSNAFVFLAGMKEQSITFEAPAAKTLSDATFNLSATASSGLPVTLVSADPAVATISGNTVTLKGAGSTVITASQPGNSEYSPAVSVEHTLEVSKSTQTISFTLEGSKSFGDAPFALQATSSAGLPVSYTSTNTEVATVSGNTVTVVSPGTTTIKANQAGNDIFAAAAEVSKTFTVAKGVQTITFDQSLAKKFTEVSLTLTATASSGLPVTYQSANPAIATISGNVVTFVAKGQVTITASQPGNTSYEAAANVSRALVIENSPPVAVKSIPQQEAMQLMPFTFTFDAGVFNDADNDALTYTALQESGQPLPAWLTLNAGTRTFSGTPGMADRSIDIQLKASDAFNGSAMVRFKIAIAVITSVETTPEQELRVYPNPVQHTLVIQHNVSGETLRHVVIRSAVGGSVYENGSPGESTEVDTSQWKPGFYLVEVRTGKTVHQTKIIKL